MSLRLGALVLTDLDKRWLETHRAHFYARRERAHVYKLREFVESKIKMARCWERCDECEDLALCEAEQECLIFGDPDWLDDPEETDEEDD